MDGEWVVDPTLINAGAAVVITWTAAEGYTIVSGETEEFEMDCDRTAKSPVVAAATVDVTGVSLDKTTGEMMVGEELTLVATVAPDNATDKTVTWETSDAEVATVADGVVTAVAAGEVTITAKAGEQSASCTITVKQSPLRVLVDAGTLSFTGTTAKWAGNGDLILEYKGETGTLVLPGNATAWILSVGGGGAGGSSKASTSLTGVGAGGGGAGQFCEKKDQLLTGGTYVVTVGAGGMPGTLGSGSNGGNGLSSKITLNGSELTEYTAVGGGGGGDGSGNDGASGGGGAGAESGRGSGGAALVGQQGGNGEATLSYSVAGGGGGAGSPGGAGISSGNPQGGTGGAGLPSMIVGNPNAVYYAAGGGGGAYRAVFGSVPGGNGGNGGGGNGADRQHVANAGAPNTGSGGGGGCPTRAGGAGGSGIVIIRISDVVSAIDFTITAAEGVTVEWSADGGATWTAYAPGAKAPAGDIQIRLKEGKFGVKTLNMTLSADNNAFDVSDVEIPKTIPLAKWSDSFDGESAASTKVGGSKISYMGDWQNPQYVEVRDGSDKAVVIADNCSPYKTSLVAAGSDFSFLTVAKMFRSKTKSSVISYFGNQSSGLCLVYNDKKVKLVDRASRCVIAEYADANVERQFHAYLVTFDNETKTVQFFVDGVKIEPKSTDTVGSHPGTGYQLGAIFGGASFEVDDVSTKKGIDIEVDEIAIWDADVGEVAPEIAEKFPVWPEEEDLPALVDVALEPGKNTTVSQIVLNGKVVDGLDEKEREGDTIEVTFAANARYAFAEGEDGVRTVTVEDEAVTITGPDADYFIGNVYATGRDFNRFVLENGEVTQLEEGDTIICDAAHYNSRELWLTGPNIGAFAAHLIVFRQEMDCGAGAGIPANGQVEIDFNAPVQKGVYLYGDIGESARVSGKGILYLGYDMGHGDNVCCTINDGVEISANVSFQQPNPNETRKTIRTVTINGAVKITGAVDATYGLFKLADGAELTVAKLDDGKVVTDVVGKKVVYADGRYMLVSIQVEVTPQPEAGSTAKVYQDGVEVTGNPVKVERDSAVDVVFTANAGHCFADFTSVKTNTVTAAEDPTVVVGPAVIAGQSAGETAYAVTKDGICKLFGTGVATELPTGIDRSSVKSVEVADGVTEIGKRFFKDCRRMNTLRCGKDVVKFGEKAFYLCLSLESIEIANPNFDMDSLANAIVYQAAIDENGKVYTIPRISAEGYEEVLYGKANLTDGEWTRFGPAGSVTMEESGCHFFHIRLEKVAK